MVAEFLGQGFFQRLYAIRVVGAVEQITTQGGIVGRAGRTWYRLAIRPGQTEGLKPPRPVDRLQAGPQGVIVHRKTMRFKKFQAGQGQGGVALLVAALHAAAQLLHPAAVAVAPVGKAPPLARDNVKVPPQQGQGGIEFLAASLHHPEHLIAAHPRHHRHARLDHPGLFESHGGQVSAQIGLVVHGDVGDDADQRRDDVGGVQPASHADLEDAEIHLLFGEPEEGQGGGELEVGDLAAV